MNNPAGLLADTNTLIRLLEGDELISMLPDGQTVYISVIMEIEMQCKPNQPANERELIQSLLTDCIVVELTPQVKAEAIRVRQATRLKLMDSIVAASALVMGMPVITGDNAFERVSQINLLLLPPR